MLQKAEERSYPYQEGLTNSLFKENREKFLALFRKKIGTGEGLTNSIALFKGVSDIPIYNSDINYPFYQEGNFYYLFGI